MTYVKTDWVDGTTPLNAANLDKMEQGIFDAQLPDRLGVEALLITDWNAAIQNGWYRGSPGANAPAAFTGTLVIGRVERAEGFVTQTVWQYATANENLATSYQRRYDGDWGPWLAWPAASGGGSTDLVYNGEYPAASPYTDGDIVIYNGQAYLCVRPTSSPPTPWAGAALPGVVKLAEIVLAATATAFDITGIDQTFTDLILTGIAKSDQAAAGVLQMRFNGDTGANYDHQNNQSSGSTTSGASGVAVSSIYACIVAPTASPNPSTFEITIPAYAAATPLTRVTSGRHGYGNGWSMVTTGGWRSTAAINRIQLTLSSGNLQIGSRVTLWGRR